MHWQIMQLYQFKRMPKDSDAGSNPTCEFQSWLQTNSVNYMYVVDKHFTTENTDQFTVLVPNIVGLDQLCV